MDLFDRTFRLHNILKHAHFPVSRSHLQEKLECSRATANRIIRDMRNYLGAPIEFDREAGGYHYAPRGELLYELPGLWFNASELQALLAVQQLLAEVQPGLLENQINPLRERIQEILKSKHMGCAEVSKRVRILSMAARRTDPDHFKIVAGAVLQHKCLNLTYHSRSRNATTQRTVSPQRLTRYRENWYLDAWDHGKQALRSFAVECIQYVRQLDKPAKQISEKRLDDHFAAAYGIFAGKPKHTAILRFTPERARWVAEEIWHPQQKSSFVNGNYMLEVPYSDSRELVMDILKHGPEVQVLAPETLRQEVVELLKQALSRQRQK
jgi:predicted DNA-binding transcriptional regulator YafY